MSVPLGWVSPSWWLASSCCLCACCFHCTSPDGPRCGSPTKDSTGLPLTDQQPLFSPPTTAPVVVDPLLAKLYDHFSSLSYLTSPRWLTHLPSAPLETPSLACTIPSSELSLSSWLPPSSLLGKVLHCLSHKYWNPPTLASLVLFSSYPADLSLWSPPSHDFCTIHGSCTPHGVEYHRSVRYRMPHRCPSRSTCPSGTYIFHFNPALLLCFMTPKPETLEVPTFFHRHPSNGSPSPAHSTFFLFVQLSSRLGSFQDVRLNFPARSNSHSSYTASFMWLAGPLESGPCLPH